MATIQIWEQDIRVIFPNFFLLLKTPRSTMLQVLLRVFNPRILFLRIVNAGKQGYFFLVKTSKTRKAMQRMMTALNIIIILDKS